MRVKILLAVCSVFVLGRAPAYAADPLGKAENVIVVTIDGLRWQEVFGGADATMINDPTTRPFSPVVLRNMYLKPTPEARRERLMPFLWGTVAKQGQIFGDRASNCVATVTNPHHFSYPGYSEMTVGFVEPRIKSNDALPNPNPTVYEWLNKRPGFEGKVGVLAAWERIYDVINPERSGVYISAGWRPLPKFHDEPFSEREATINDMLAVQTRYWAEEPPDAFPRLLAMNFLEAHKPRVMWLSLGEVDEWAHANRYDLYLKAIEDSDAALRDLWELTQTLPAYAGKTALIVITDHGRGNTLKTWTSHGTKYEGSDGIWVAVMGPDTPPLGVRKDVSVTQSQFAATVAALVGQDFRADHPKAAEPLPGVTR